MQNDSYRYDHGYLQKQNLCIYKTREMVLIRTNEYPLGQQVTFSSKDIITPLRFPRLNDFRARGSAAILAVGALLFGIIGPGIAPRFTRHAPPLFHRHQPQH